MSTRYLSLVEKSVRNGRDARSVPAFRAWMQTRIAGRAFPPHVLLLPGAADAPKKWPLDRYLELAGRLRDTLPVTLVLGPDEREERDALRPSLRERNGVSVLTANGGANDVEVVDTPPLPELLARIDAAELVVSNDCGPSHLAQLSGRRFLGIYRSGWSTLADWFLDKENSDLVVSGDGGWESVPVDRVAERASALFAAPPYAETIVRFARDPESTPSASSS